MTAKAVDSVEQELLRNNDEYKKLHTDHLEYESQLEALNQKKFLSAEEDVEFKRIKKLKLQGKDRMDHILQEARAKG